MIHSFFFLQRSNRQTQICLNQTTRQGKSKDCEDVGAKSHSDFVLKVENK